MSHGWAGRVMVAIGGDAECCMDVPGYRHWAIREHPTSHTGRVNRRGEEVEGRREKSIMDTKDRS